MNHEILDALSQITREKSVDRAMLIETLEVGLASAVRRKYGATADVEVRFSNESCTPHSSRKTETGSTYRTTADRRRKGAVPLSSQRMLGRR